MTCSGSSACTPATGKSENGGTGSRSVTRQPIRTIITGIHGKEQSLNIRFRSLRRPGTFFSKKKGAPLHQFHPTEYIIQTPACKQIIRQMQAETGKTIVKPPPSSKIKQVPSRKKTFPLHPVPPTPSTASRQLFNKHLLYASCSVAAYTLLMMWGTAWTTSLLTEEGHTAVRSQLAAFKPFFCVFGVFLLLYVAGCRVYRLRHGMPRVLSRGTGNFCLASFVMGAFSFLGYAWLTASYSPPDSASAGLFIPSAYTHEFSGSALLFCLVLPSGLLSLAASLLASTNRVPGIKDMLAVLWCLVAPFLCIFLLRTP